MSADRNPLPFPPLNAKRTRARIQRLMCRLPDVVTAEDDSHDLALLDAYWSHLDRIEGQA